MADPDYRYLGQICWRSSHLYIYVYDIIQSGLHFSFVQLEQSRFKGSAGSDWWSWGFKLHSLLIIIHHLEQLKTHGFFYKNDSGLCYVSDVMK